MIKASEPVFTCTKTNEYLRIIKVLSKRDRLISFFYRSDDAWIRPISIPYWPEVWSTRIEAVQKYTAGLGKLLVIKFRYSGNDSVCIDLRCIRMRNGMLFRRAPLSPFPIEHVRSHSSHLGTTLLFTIRFRIQERILTLQIRPCSIQSADTNLTSAYQFGSKARQYTGYFQCIRPQGQYTHPSSLTVLKR
jgi:hypothetical protein